MLFRSIGSKKVAGLLLESQSQGASHRLIVGIGFNVASHPEQIPESTHLGEFHESRTLQFLRQQAGLSTRGAAKASGLKDGIINHLEHGRVRVHPHHLEALLPAYGATRKTYEMFASGKVPLPQDLRKECLEIVQEMSPEQLQTAHPVLQSLSKNN